MVRGPDGAAVPEADVYFEIGEPVQPNATISGQAVGEDGTPADVQAYIKMCF